MGLLVPFHRGLEAEALAADAALEGFTVVVLGQVCEQLLSQAELIVAVPALRVRFFSFSVEFFFRSF